MKGKVFKLVGVDAREHNVRAHAVNQHQTERCKDPIAQVIYPQDVSKCLNKVFH